MKPPYRRSVSVHRPATDVMTRRRTVVVAVIPAHSAAGCERLRRSRFHLWFQQAGMAGLALLLLAGCATSSGGKPGTPKKTAKSSAGFSETGSIESLRKAVGKNPQDPDVQYKLGNALFDEQRYGEAASAYGEVIRLAPRRASAHTNLGLSLKRLGRMPEAVAAYRQALALDPNDVTTARDLAIALEAAGDIEGAVQPFRRLTELQPEDVRGWLSLARATFQLERYEEAAKAFETVLRLDPGLADNYYNLGVCYFHLEKWDLALAAWTTALAHDPKNPSVNKGLAVLHWKRGDYARAWNAVVQCQSLGITLDAEFLANLKRDSGQQEAPSPSNATAETAPTPTPP